LTVLQGDHVQQKAIVVAQACCYNPEPEPDYADSNEGDEYESEGPGPKPYNPDIDEYDSDTPAPKPTPKPHKPEEPHKGHTKPHYGTVLPPTYDSYGRYAQQQGVGAGVPVLGEAAGAQGQASVPIINPQAQKSANYRVG
jgi:hypothetical protein